MTTGIITSTDSIHHHGDNENYQVLTSKLMPAFETFVMGALANRRGLQCLTHINDASFWLFKGYFDLSVKDTLKTWGLLELVNSVVGLVIVLIISMIV